jgi:hypothetical protein
MFCRARRFAVMAFLTCVPAALHAQAVWQPAAAPLVTAENAAWFQAADPIEWNGDIYYQAGAVQAFNAYQMVRSGSYRGIPLYTDSTLEPFGIVFVPLAGARMQPYERRRTGMLAGTTGSQAPSLPTDIGAEAATNSIREALAAPVLGRPYEIVTEPATVVVTTPAPVPSVAEPQPVGTSGRSVSTAPPRPVTSAIPPTGQNAIWVSFDGRRWDAAGKAIDYDASILDEVGTYRGWTVYTRKGDPTVIYIPSIPGRLAAYRAR